MSKTIRKINFVVDDTSVQRLAVPFFVHKVLFSRALSVVFSAFFVMSSAVFFDMPSDRLDRLMAVSALLNSGGSPIPSIVGGFCHG